MTSARSATQPQPKSVPVVWKLCADKRPNLRPVCWSVQAWSVHLSQQTLVCDFLSKPELPITIKPPFPILVWVETGIVVHNRVFMTWSLICSGTYLEGLSPLQSEVSPKMDEVFGIQEKAFLRL